MATLFNQVIGTESDLRTVAVSAYSVMDMADDEDGNSVVYEHWQAAVTKSVRYEQDDGRVVTKTTSRVVVEVDEIDAMIAALQVAKREIYAKRMEAATEWFNANREEEAQAQAEAAEVNANQ